MLYELRPLWVNFDTTYFIESEKIFLIWDLLKIWKDYYLIVWNKKWTKELKNNILYYWNLFNPTTIYFQQFLKNYWYSRYFKFFKLYIQDIKHLNKYELPKIKKHKFETWEEYINKYKNYETYNNYIKNGDTNIKTININNFSIDLLSKKQNLIVFPDNWSLFNFYNKYNIWDILDINTTSLTRYKFFFNVKTWKIKTLLTTHWWVFQDRKSLQTIFVFFPYKWYYKNQQNPRYLLPELIKQMKFFYNVKNLYFLLS